MSLDRVITTQFARSVRSGLKGGIKRGSDAAPRRFSVDLETELHRAKMALSKCLLDKVSHGMVAKPRLRVPPLLRCGSDLESWLTVGVPRLGKLQLAWGCL